MNASLANMSASRNAPNPEPPGMLAREPAASAGCDHRIVEGGSRRYV
jgi:hypothetical protein